MNIIFYIYGIILSAIAVGFFVCDIANSSLYEHSLVKWFKLIFSLCSAWLMMAVIAGLKLDYNWFLLVIITISPGINFIGLEMILYKFFNTK